MIPGRTGDISPFRRGVYILPNLITTGGLFAGVFSITASFRGDFVLAAIAIMLANVCDVLDGRVARVTRTTSEFGVEYDSLADLVAFGVAPAMLLHRWALAPWGTWGWLAASLFVTCGALRLARFNVQFDTASKRHFVGLPIPAAAEMVVTTVLLFDYLGGQVVTEKRVVVLLFVYALAGLMVSNLPYFSFKEIDLHRRQPFWVFLGIIVLFKLFLAEPQLFLFTGCTGFVLSGPLLWLYRRFAFDGRNEPGRKESSVGGADLTRSDSSPT